MRKRKPTFLQLGFALNLLWPIGLQAQDQSLAIINAGVSSTEDAPFVTTDYKFLPGDSVYLTFAISGFKVKTDEKTEARQMGLSYTAAMQDDAGVLMQEPVRGEIKEQLSAEDKSWIPKRRASFIVPTLVAAGRYRIHLVAKDGFGGVEATVDIPFRVAGEQVEAADEIRVENFRFLRQEDSREALAVAAYRPGDSVYSAFDIVGFSRAPGNQYHVSYNIAVTGPDGKPFLASAETADVADSSFYPAAFLPERADVLTKPNNLRGEYTIVLTVKDVLSQKTATYRRAFTLE